jgi:putative peptidoglycan lipid II flippase
MPCTLGSLLYSGEVIQAVYERGAFGDASTELTSTAFFYYSFGLVFLMMQSFTVSAFYSRHNTKTPLVVAAACVVINVTANLVLVKFLAHGGLALGWSIATFCNAAALWIIIRKHEKGILQEGFVSKNMRVVAASFISIGVSYAFFLSSRAIFTAQNWLLPQTVLLTAAVLVAAAVYILLLRLFKIKELTLLKQMFRTRSQ